MKTRVVLCLAVWCVMTAAEAGVVTIAQNGTAKCVLVVGPLAAPVERHAADELASFLRQVTGAPVEIVDRRDADKSNLLVGADAARMVDPDFSTDGLARDGIVIRTVGDDLILAGGRPRGTLYAVYTLLEDQVGCRWWSFSVSTIPKKPTLTVGRLNVRYVPALEYRETNLFGATDGDWSARNKCNGDAHEVRAEQGGRYLFEPHFCHTFYMLIPPDKYFKEHPEWFSFRDGKRFVGSGDVTLREASLCLTNEDMRRELVKNLKQVLREQREGIKHKVHNREHPLYNHDNADVVIAEVDPPDSGGELWCQCAQCTAVEKAEGNPSGLMIRFVNAVAEDLESEFPEVLVATLAYHETRKPPYPDPDRPTITKPRDNVIVRLSTIKGSFSRPFTDARNTAVRQDLIGWSKICKRLHVWDYVANHTHLKLPHPNLRVLAPNIREYVDLGVTGVYAGVEQNPCIEVTELRSWMLAKLMWDPSLDGQELIEEFCQGYYGPAGKHVVAYLDVTHDAAEATDDWMGLSNPPSAEFLSADTLDRAWAHLKAAEAAVQNDGERLERVQKVQEAVQYAYEAQR